MAAPVPLDVLHCIAEAVVQSRHSQKTVHSCCLVSSHFREAFSPFLTRHVRFAPPLRKLRRHGHGGGAINQKRQTGFLTALSRAPGLHRAVSFTAVLFSDPNDPLSADAIDVLADVFSRLSALASFSLR
jgi:hypothetical protein